MVQWLFQFPVSFLFTFNFFLALGSFGCALFCRERLVFWIISSLCLLLGLTSSIKSHILGVPLLPWDFLLAKEVTEIVNVNWRGTSNILAGSLLLCLFLAGLYYSIPNKKLNLGIQRRLSWLFASLVLFLILILKNNPLHDYLFTHQFKLENKNQNVMLATNGLIINFIMNIERGAFYPPTNYSEGAAKEIFDLYSRQAQNRHADSSIRPDIIVVMSESLFDPQELPGVHWKKDPLQFTRRLVNGKRMSYAVVPSFGGKTANSEFEFLTGNSMRFLARGVVPYNQLLEHDQQSLPRTLKNQGYRTVAIHPGERSFYRRDFVYPKLGFDTYLADEHFRSASKIGQYYSDQSILEVLQKSLLEDSNPSFHFIVTLQNHMPYQPNPFDLNDVLFEPTMNMSRAEQVVLNHYSRLVAETDLFHKNLVNFLKSRKRPTVLLIFGDHLPALLPDYQVFQKQLVSSLDSSQWSSEEYLRMHSTPLVTWSNFGYVGESSPIEVSLLGPRLLKQLGLKLNPYQEFTYELSQHVRIINPNFKYDLDPIAQKYWDQYKIFQYGMMSGLFEHPYLGLQN